MSAFHDAVPHLGPDQPGPGRPHLDMPPPGGHRGGVHPLALGGADPDCDAGLAERLFHLGSFVALTAPMVDETDVRLSIEAAVVELAEVIGVRHTSLPESSRPAPDGATAAGMASLSPREREVVILVADGATDKEIARRLYLSVNTVHSHLDRIRVKTGRRGRVAIAALAAGTHVSAGQEGRDG